MSDGQCFIDAEAARLDGEEFGRMVGASTTAEMIRFQSDPEQVRRAGIEGAKMMVERVKLLTRIAGNLDFVQAWTEAAAEAFAEELDDHVALMLADMSLTSLNH